MNGFSSLLDPANPNTTRDTKPEIQKLIDEYRERFAPKTAMEHVCVDAMIRSDLVLKRITEMLPDDPDAFLRVIQLFPRFEKSYFRAMRELDRLKTRELKDQERATQLAELEARRQTAIARAVDAEAHKKRIEDETRGANPIPSQPKTNLVPIDLHSRALTASLEPAPINTPSDPHRPTLLDSSKHL